MTFLPVPSLRTDPSNPLNEDDVLVANPLDLIPAQINSPISKALAVGCNRLLSNHHVTHSIQ